MSAQHDPAAAEHAAELTQEPEPVPLAAEPEPALYAAEHPPEAEPEPAPYAAEPQPEPEPAPYAAEHAPEAEPVRYAAEHRPEPEPVAYAAERPLEPDTPHPADPEFEAEPQALGDDQHAAEHAVYSEPVEPAAPLDAAGAGHEHDPAPDEEREGYAIPGLPEPPGAEPREGLPEPPRRMRGQSRRRCAARSAAAVTGRAARGPPGWRAMAARRAAAAAVATGARAGSQSWRCSRSGSLSRCSCIR